MLKICLKRSRNSAHERSKYKPRFQRYSKAPKFKACWRITKNSLTWFTMPTKSTPIGRSKMQSKRKTYFSSKDSLISPRNSTFIRPSSRLMMLSSYFDLWAGRESASSCLLTRKTDLRKPLLRAWTFVNSNRPSFALLLKDKSTSTCWRKGIILTWRQWIWLPWKRTKPSMKLGR